MTFASTLIWYHTQTNTHIVHTRTNRLIHKYILTATVMGSQQLSITDIKTLFYQSQQYLPKSHICWLDSIRLSPSCETQDIDRICENEQKTHKSQRWHWKGLVSLKISDNPYCRTNPQFYQPFPFMGKIFLVKIKKLEPPFSLYKEESGFQLCEYISQCVLSPVGNEKLRFSVVFKLKRLGRASHTEAAWNKRHFCWLFVFVRDCFNFEVYVLLSICNIY